MDPTLVDDVLHMAKNVLASQQQLRHDFAAVAALEADLGAASRLLSEAAIQVQQDNQYTTNIITAFPIILETQRNLPLVRFAASALLHKLSAGLEKYMDSVNAMHSAVGRANRAYAELCQAKHTANASINEFNERAQEWTECKAAWAMSRGNTPPLPGIPAALFDVRHRPHHMNGIAQNYIGDARRIYKDKGDILLEFFRTYHEPCVPIHDDQVSHTVQKGVDRILNAYVSEFECATRTREHKVKAAAAHMQAYQEAYDTKLTRLQAATAAANTAREQLRIAQTRNKDATTNVDDLYSNIKAIVHAPAAVSHTSDQNDPGGAGDATTAIAHADSIALRFSTGLFNRISDIGHADASAVTKAIQSLKIDASYALNARKLANETQFVAKAMEALHRIKPMTTPLQQAPPVLGTRLYITPSAAHNTHNTPLTWVKATAIHLSSFNLSPTRITATCTGTCKELHIMHGTNFVCSTCAAAFMSPW
jgi:hypothetical protein